MESFNLTEQEITDIINGLYDSIHRLRNKIKNDERHGRQDQNRVGWRKEKMDRVELLIKKLNQNIAPCAN